MEIHNDAERAADSDVSRDKIFNEEIRQINKRRRQVKREQIKVAAQGAGQMRMPFEGVGLALSGGGIRSAAFCLGALQALDRADLIRQVDYLSCVSGGGYIGASLAAGMSESKGKFPFESKLDLDETASIQHVRDHSNFLLPRFGADLLKSSAIYLRGLAANFVLIAPYVFALAALTVVADRNRVDQKGFPYFAEPPEGGMPWSTSGAVVLLICFIAWSLGRSRSKYLDASEVDTPKPSYFGWAVVALSVLVFAEIQPVILRSMLYTDAYSEFGSSTDWSRLLNVAAQVLTVVTAAVGFFGRFLAQSGAGAGERGASALIAKWTSRVAIYLAAFSIPFILWVIYINLAFVGLKMGVCQFRAPDFGCMQYAKIVQFVGWKSSWPWVWFPVIAYLAVGVLLFVFSFFLRPNSNSLNRLYRDRLSRAFLFKPRAFIGKDEKLENLERYRISDIEAKYAPYLLINAALNVQSSQLANRRGRNADFFTVSPSYIGSEATGYVRTKLIEDQVRDFDLATAMAFSGAAASANMGGATIKALVPTLTMMNVRLGYWLLNPKFAHNERRKVLENRVDLYFLFELLGSLHENRDVINITDGGHIENLGIYELLKRRCRFIIAVDAEADPQMVFPSFVMLQRYARIDLGIRIDLPWHAISEQTRSVSDEIAEGRRPIANRGPHCAIGVITYPNSERGYLIYLKSSLTGDENDYVMDYKRRYESFPHEATFDQFFSEEQFEAYRALGYHATQGIFPARNESAAGGKSPTLVRRDSISLCVDLEDEDRSRIEAQFGVKLEKGRLADKPHSR